MEIEYFRSSSYNSFSLCQHSYFLDYNLGIRQKSNASAEKGTIFHKVMECLANIKLQIQQNNKSGIIEDDALGFIEWSEDSIYEKDVLYKLADQSFDYFISKSANNFTKKDKDDLLKWCDIIYQDDNFYPLRRNIIRAEQYFDIPIECKWAKLPNGEYLRLKGTVDLIASCNDDVIEAIDWKTGKRMDWGNFQEKTYSKLQKDPQLLLYNYALSKLYPNQELMITIYYVKDGGPLPLSFNTKDIKLMENLLYNQYLSIQECKCPHLKDNGKGRFCRYICSYGKTMSRYEPTLTQCQFFHKEIGLVGIDNVVRRYREKDHKLSNYEAPGT